MTYQKGVYIRVVRMAHHADGREADLLARPCFGGEPKDYEVGDEVQGFATPHIECARQVAAQIGDEVSYWHNWPSDEPVAYLILEDCILEDDLDLIEAKKSGHSDRTDRDEVYVIRARVARIVRPDHSTIPYCIN